MLRLYSPHPICHSTRRLHSLYDRTPVKDPYFPGRGFRAGKGGGDLLLLAAA